jgi:hypothetical protein
MSDRNRLPPLTDAERAALIEAYLKSKPRRDLIEKRRHEQGRINSDDAIRQRNDFDVFDP